MTARAQLVAYLEANKLQHFSAVRAPILWTTVACLFSIGVFGFLHFGVIGLIAATYCSSYLCNRMYYSDTLLWAVMFNDINLYVKYNTKLLGKLSDTQIEEVLALAKETDKEAK